MNKNNTNIFTQMEKIAKMEAILTALFDIECPPEPEGMNTYTKDELFIINKKWYDFWDRMRPTLNNPNINVYTTDQLNRAMICDGHIMGILHGLKELGLDKEFIIYMRNFEKENSLK